MEEYSESANISALATAWNVFANDRYGGRCLRSQLARPHPEDIIGGHEQDILLIPGIGGTGGEITKRVLNVLGEDANIYFPHDLPRRKIGGLLPNPFRNTERPDISAENIAERIREITAQTGRKIMLVCYSMGTAAGEEACLLEGIRDQVSNVVSIAGVHGALQIKGRIIPKLLFGAGPIDYFSEGRAAERAEAYLKLGIPTEYHVFHQWQRDNDGVLPTAMQAPKKRTENVRISYHSGTSHLDFIDQEETAKMIFR